MRSIQKIKLAVDAAMTVALLLLMAYGLVGEAAHEWIGMGMFALFVAHHILNRKWLLAVGKGKYTPVRMVQTLLAGVISLCMLGSMVSGIFLLRYVFSFLPKHGGYEAAQKAHLLRAYWGLSLHEPASGASLEQDADNGAQALAALTFADVEPAPCRLALGAVWCICASPQECRPLSAAQKPFRVLRLFRACDLLPDRLFLHHGAVYTG